jgi:hypothetical protein
MLPCVRAAWPADALRVIMLRFLDILCTNATAQVRYLCEDYTN